MQSDILRLLQLQSPYRIVTGFDRPNPLFRRAPPEKQVFRPSPHSLTSEEAEAASSTVQRARRSSACATACVTAASPPTRYPRRPHDEERQQNQDDFQFDRKTVMVATNGLRHGHRQVKLSPLSSITNMPKSLEAYYQEAGRAGRDGENADCVLLFAPADVETARFLIENGRGRPALGGGCRACAQARL